MKNTQQKQDAFFCFQYWPYDRNIKLALNLLNWTHTKRFDNWLHSRFQRNFSFKMAFQFFVSCKNTVHCFSYFIPISLHKTSFWDLYMSLTTILPCTCKHSNHTFVSCLHFHFNQIRSNDWVWICAMETVIIVQSRCFFRFTRSIIKGPYNSSIRLCENTPRIKLCTWTMRQSTWCLFVPHSTKQTTSVSLNLKNEKCLDEEFSPFQSLYKELCLSSMCLHTLNSCIVSVNLLWHHKQVE